MLQYLWYIWADNIMNKTILFLFLTAILFSCAEIVPPSGGEKDITAPKIKTSTPANETIFFDYNRIELKFDEFIKFRNSSENIFITPSLTKKPIFKHFGKKITISFQEELLPNTTYSIILNESIEDYNEGNKLEVFNYVFSTGAYIDSLKIEGTLLDAFNKKPIEKAYILLYTETEDSILYKKPLYIAKTNSNGKYSINNLKAGNYKIAALEDKNLNLIFDQKEERIAFSTEILNIEENIVLAPLFLFKNEPKVYIESQKQEANNHYTFTFNKALENLSVDISDFTDGDITYLSTDKKTLHYWYQNTDSLTTFLFTINKTFTDTIIKSLKIDTFSVFNIETKTFKNEENNNIELTFTKPIRNFNAALLNIKTLDSVAINYTYKWKENNKTLIIKTSNKADSLILAIDNNSFIAIDNNTNKSKIKILSAFENTKSDLLLNLPSNSSILILQLLNSEEKIIEELNVSRETFIKFPNLNTGKYFIRIYKDDNNNGIWDNGLFHVKQFPEETIFYSTEITISPNFDKELDIKY